MPPCTNLKQLADGKTLSREECLRLFPGLKDSDLSGAITFYDAQMYSPSRLAISFLRSAVTQGAEVANYTEITGFLHNKNRVYGVRAVDRLSGHCFEVQGRIIINTAGPWSEGLLSKQLGIKLKPKLSYSKDSFFVLKKQIFKDHAIGIQCSSKDSDSLLKSGFRHLFIAPWKNISIIGVWHNSCDAPSDKASVTKQEICRYIDEINQSYPALSISPDDIAGWNAGYVLFGKNTENNSRYSFGKRSVLIDHERQHQISGLITLIGVRFTTSRIEAERTLDLVFKKLGKKVPKSQTTDTAVFGGDIMSFDEYLKSALNNNGYDLSSEVMRALTHNYGSQLSRVLNYIKEDKTLSSALPNSTVLKAEVVHAVREEMVQKLSDVVFRRTDLGTVGNPGLPTITECAQLVGKELGWNDERIKKEIDEVNSKFVC